MNPTQFKDAYLSEFEDHLQQLNDNMLKLEKKPADKKTMDALMRSAHTLKSSSATMGYEKTAHLTHQIEDVFHAGINGKLKISPSIITILFDAIDLLQKGYTSIQKQNKEQNTATISAKIQNVTGITTDQKQRKEKKPATEKKSQPKAKKTSQKKQTEDIAEDQNLPEQKQETISHIKIPVQKLDNLMNLMEELQVITMQFQNRDSKDTTQAHIEQLDHVVKEMHYHVLQTRLVPLDQILVRFPRMVRDIAQQQKKDITLEMSGTDIELDRTIIDTLAEPLTHLIRNAIDHGIDTKGTIRISAYKDRSFVCIAVEDDGNGIDWDTIAAAGVKHDLVDKQTAAQDCELIQQRLAEMKQNKEPESTIAIPPRLLHILFSPSISSKTKVTTLSGRGYGLNIVKSFVDKINGEVQVETPTTYNPKAPKNPFSGTRFVLRLPLQVAIVQVLLVQVDDTFYAVPFTSVLRTLHIQEDSIHEMISNQMIVVDNQDIPLISVKDVVQTNMVTSSSAPSDSAPPEGKQTTDQVSSYYDTMNIVLVRYADQVAGLVVDDVISEHDVIIKTLPPILRDVKGISGTTMIGDGSMAFVLDIVSLLESYQAAT